MGCLGWEKGDSYHPLPTKNKGVIQPWPKHCAQGLGRNDCLKDSAGSEQWDTALHAKSS